MRKLALFLSLIMIIGLTSCTPHGESNDTTDSEEQTHVDYVACGNSDILEGFATVLTNEGYAAAMSQSDLRNIVKRYSFEGTSLDELIMFFHYDGEYGGGMQGSGEHFGYSNDYKNYNSRVTYTNYFYTNVPIDGMVLPYGISFDDDISSALEKLGLDIDTGSREKTVLISSETSELVLFNHSFSELEDTINKYSLIYTETKNITRADGTPAKLTRTLNMFFDDWSNTDKLFQVQVSVREEWNS